MSEPGLMVAQTISWTLAIILFATVAAKVADRARFVGAVHAYRILPDLLVPSFAATFMLGEIVASILLASVKYSKPGLVVAIIVIVTASVGLIVNLLRGRVEINCGCGGGERQGLSWSLVIRNAVLCLLAACAIAWHSELPLEHLAVMAPMLLMASASAVIYFGYNQLEANATMLRRGRHDP